MSDNRLGQPINVYEDRHTSVYRGLSEITGTTVLHMEIIHQPKDRDQAKLLEVL